jgi:hypothetical protein
MQVLFYFGQLFEKRLVGYPLAISNYVLPTLTGLTLKRQ